MYEIFCAILYLLKEAARGEQYRTVSFNKLLAHAIGVHEAMIFSVLIAKHRIDERREYLNIIRENIEYDSLSEKEKADELVAIMLDVVCSTSDTVRVNGEDMPHEVVKSRFLKLNSSHIDYVLTALQKNTSDVRNIRAYLITALYNDPETMDSFYTAWVNHGVKSTK